MDSLDPAIEEFVRKHGSYKKFCKLYSTDGLLAALGYYAQLRIKRHREILRQIDFEKKHNLRPL